MKAALNIYIYLSDTIQACARTYIYVPVRATQKEIYLAQLTLWQNSCVVCEFFFIPRFFFFFVFLVCVIFKCDNNWLYDVQVYGKNTQIADNKRQHIYRIVPSSSLTFKQFSEANRATYEFPLNVYRVYNNSFLVANVAKASTTPRWCGMVYKVCVLRCIRTLLW